MEKYFTTDVAIGRVRFGTKLIIRDEITNEVYFDDEWSRRHNPSRLDKRILDAEIMTMLVDENTLIIQVVP